MKNERDIWSSARMVLGGKMLSVVMPLYRLAQVIETNLDEVMRFLDAAGISYEIVPVEDGSGDGSEEILLRCAAAHPEVIRPVCIKNNAGKGNALKTGFRASKGEFVLLLDGDLDCMPSAIPGFFDSLVENGSDVVIGSKRNPLSKVKYPWHRRLSSIVYFSIVKALVGLPVTDSQVGMKLFKRDVLGGALDRMLVKTYAFDLELLSIAFQRGAKISEAPIELRLQTQFGCLKPRTVFDMLNDTLAVFYRLRILDYYSKVEVPPQADHEMCISVVIACPADSWMLQEGLKALSRQTYRNFEVIVLPDGEAAFEIPKGVVCRVFPTGKVRPAEKRYLGIEKATGEIVAFLDDDAYPDEHWLENAVKYFTEPTIGALGGPGVTPPGDGFLARAGGRVYSNIFVSGNYRYRYVSGRVRLDVDDYPSCNLFVRTELLRKIGGYRTDFWPGEDTLLCEDIVFGEKKRLVYDPWTVVYHHRRALFMPHLRQLTRYALHRGYFAKRHPATSLKLSYFLPSAFVVGLIVGAISLFLTYGMGMECPFMGYINGVYIMCVAIYCLLVAVSTVSLNPFLWIVTFLGVFASHVGYGVRFLVGLASRRMPCEYIGRDHARH